MCLAKKVTDFNLFLLLFLDSLRKNADMLTSGKFLDPLICKYTVERVYLAWLWHLWCI